MALASGRWLGKEMKGEPPSPRHGHAVAVAGNVAFLFGGASSINQEEDNPVYLKDFYMLTVSLHDVMWEEIPQSGELPSAREGHTLCVVNGKLYLFGGVSSPDTTECLPGVYSFDIVSLTWDSLATGGVALRTLRHSSAAVGENIYVYGGSLGGSPTNDLMVFNTVSLMWTPVKTSGSLPPALCDQTFALAGNQVYMFGGYGAGGDFCKHLYVLKTAKMKWKVPLYIGIPPARRHGHTAFILHSHFQPGVMLCLSLISHFEHILVLTVTSFTPTKVPNVRYELSELALSDQCRNAAANAQVCVYRDFSAVRDQAMKMVQTAFTLLDHEFQKLDRYVCFALFRNILNHMNVSPWFTG
uniref:host cell factor 2 n=1 Tax=Monopterus albus TaxID=43700 RepID=UPI0009B31EC8|nr:host cell factor 2-like [Monopterus albus]